MDHFLSTKIENFRCLDNGGGRPGQTLAKRRCPKPGRPWQLKCGTRAGFMPGFFLVSGIEKRYVTGFGFSRRDF